MRKRNSEWSLRDATQLVIAYISATEMVFDVRPFVHGKHYPKFREFEKRLRDNEVSPKDYANTIMIVMEKWVDNKGMSILPIKVFLGDFAWNKYMKIRGQDTVIISDDSNAIILHDELTVARLYVESNIGNEVVKLRKIVSELRPILSDQWLELYENGGKRPVAQVTDILIEQYAIMFAADYNDIVGALR